MRVVVVGQGYVGLPLAMRAVEVGHTVVGYEYEPARVLRLEGSESYVEDVRCAQLTAALATGRYLPSSDEQACHGFDMALVTVPTPLRDGAPDLSFIEVAGRTLARYLRPGTCVVLESTTYPGTTEELLAPALEEGSGLVAGTDFHLGYSPERVDPGNRTWGLCNTPKVVSGVDGPSLAVVKAFYDTLVEHTVGVSSTRVAELVKLMENTFRHVNIALANELAVFAAELKIDMWEALEAAATKPYGYMRFNPGPGVGGHCLPIDPTYLSWRVKRSLGHNFRFVELANDVNDHMPDYVVRRLTLALNRQSKAVRGSRILLLGLAYKPNTSDARESPALVVAERLLALGAEVRAVDPHVDDDHIDKRVVRTVISPEEVAAADAVVVLTDHDSFDYTLVAAGARYVLDTRGRLTGDTVEHL